MGRVCIAICVASKLRWLAGRTDIVIQTREIGAGLDTRSAARAVEVFVEDVHFDASKRQIHFGPHGLLKCQQSMMHAATESVIRCYCSNLTPGADGRVRGWAPPRPHPASSCALIGLTVSRVCCAAPLLRYSTAHFGGFEAICCCHIAIVVSLAHGMV